MVVKLRTRSLNSCSCGTAAEYVFTTFEAGMVYYSFLQDSNYWRTLNGIMSISSSVRNSRNPKEHHDASKGEANMTFDEESADETTKLIAHCESILTRHALTIQ
jgi:hypothetical protein